MKIQTTLEFLDWVLFLLEEQFLHIWQPLNHTHTHSEFAQSLQGIQYTSCLSAEMDTRWYPVVEEEENGRACLGIQKLVENLLPPTLCSLHNSSFGRQSDLNK